MLPKIIGNASLARELCLTARKFDSKEAMDCGFVNRLFDDKVFIKAHLCLYRKNLTIKLPGQLYW